MKLFKETREISFFETSLEQLAVDQAKKRDQFLDAVNSGEYSMAEGLYKELQTISGALTLCQQTIMRDMDRKTGEEQKFQREQELAAKYNTPVPVPADLSADVIPPPKKGIFSFLKGGK